MALQQEFWNFLEYEAFQTYEKSNLFSLYVNFLEGWNTGTFSIKAQELKKAMTASPKNNFVMSLK